MSTLGDNIKDSIDESYRDLTGLAGTGLPVEPLEVLSGNAGGEPQPVYVEANPVEADSHLNDNTRGNIQLHQALNPQRGIKHDLRLAKARSQRGRVQNFVADICGVSPNKKMTKKNTLASLLWFGAKLTAGSIVFGPLVGCWLVAHTSNHDYYAKKEGVLINFMNTMLFDSLIQSPLDKDHADKFKNLSPRKKEAPAK